MIPQLLANGLVLASTDALLALGFAVIFGTTRIFHFAHGSVYGVAAYVFLFGLVGLNWPPLAAAVLALVVAAALGVLVDLLAYEPLIRRGSAPLALFITSLGLFIVFDNLISLPYGRTPQAVPNAVFPSGSIQFAGVYVTPTQVAITLITALLLLALLLFFLRTRLGIAIRAIASDPGLAEVLGVDVRQTRLAVFALGSVLAAAASVLISLDTGAIDPGIGLTAVLVATVAVIVGGIGSIAGATLGGVVLGIFHTIAAGFFSQQWADLIVFSLVLVVVIFRPTGLLGRPLSRLGR